VQHRLSEHAKEVNALLAQGAYFYVCGDAAHMAREVNSTLGKIIASERGLTEAQGEDIVKRLRSSNLYQVSLPPSPRYLHIRLCLPHICKILYPFLKRVFSSFFLYSIMQDN
jgi:hypothetical protein